MVDSLRTFSQLIANLPDNTSGLVSPQDIREAVIAGIVDMGVVSDGADWTLTLSADTWTDIPSNSTGPALDVGQFGGDGLDERDEGQVHKQNPIFRMVHNVDQL